MAEPFRKEGPGAGQISRNAVEDAEPKRPFVRRNKRDRAAKRGDWID